MVVFKIFSQDRVLLRFLELNTLMSLLGVPAEVEDLEVLNTLSQDRAQQPEVELVIAGLLVVSSSCLTRGVAASSSPVRRLSSADAAFGGFRVPVSRGRGTSPKALPSRSRSGRIQTASWRPSTSRRWVGGEGLGIPSPHLGCHYWQCCSVSSCCLRYDALCVMFPSGVAKPRMLASWLACTRRTDAVACTQPVLMVTLHFMLCSLPWSASPGCSSSWPVWTRRTVFFSLAVACARWVLLVTMHLALFSRPGSQAQDARHHGLFGPKDLWQWHV